MKNEKILKKYLIIILIVITIFLGIITFIHRYEYNKYIEEYNYKLNNFINYLDKNNISKEEIIDILNMDNLETTLIDSLGININSESIIRKNNNSYYIFVIINCILILTLCMIIIFIFLYFNYKKNKELRKIIKCIENINREKYKLNIEQYDEGELAILKNEIAKTTIMLKSIANNNLNDKINLKNSLEDISHQLKTPLTSILINIDNLIDNPDINEEDKIQFLRDIKRDANNIEFLVSSLLKLSKFDANTINFSKSKCLVRDLINNIIKNTSTLCDLKNIDITYSDNDYVIECDFKWQSEALTNILKNAIEHAYNDSTINIKCSENKVYTEISISNIGDKINKKDLPHIFERFYKGSNASSESVGIGLNLSKVIIEKDNGTISVDAYDNETKFTIKYFK